MATSVSGDLQGRQGSAVTGIVAADEIFILKSAKGSKRLIGRAPRKSGGKAKKRGLSTEEHDCVLIVRDRSGATTDDMLPDLEAPTFAAHFAPVVAKDAVLVSDGRDAHGACACPEHPAHPHHHQPRRARLQWLPHSERERLRQPPQGLAMRPFKGVASWYLPSYLGWRRAIDFTPERCLQIGYHRAST